MGTAAPGKNSPALHHFEALGLELHFQDGPIGEHGRNGTTNEDVIHILIDRIGSQNAVMASPYNDAALANLKVALHMLEKRTIDRMERGVEGTSAA